MSPAHRTGLHGPGRSSDVGPDQATFASHPSTLLHLRASFRPRRVGPRRADGVVRTWAGSPPPRSVLVPRDGVYLRSSDRTPLRHAISCERLALTPRTDHKRPAALARRANTGSRPLPDGSVSPGVGAAGENSPCPGPGETDARPAGGRVGPEGESRRPAPVLASADTAAESGKAAPLRSRRGARRPLWRRCPW